jgi:acyl-CoA thioesterase I
VPSRRALLLSASALLLAAGCSRRKPKLETLPAGSVVLALGDSLTYGTGASTETSYPTVLSRLTGWNVVNAGVPGDTAAGALARLPGLLQQHQPSLVIVSIGGNDFLRRMSPADTRANVRSICEQAAASGSQVLLVAIPELSLFAAAARSLGDHPLYEEVAAELKVPLHGRGWSEVLGQDAMRSDAVHANARGYEAFATGLAERARELGLAAGA